jgi:hypothetical protein
MANRDPSKVLTLFTDSAKKHVALIMNEIESLIHGKQYKRELDLAKLIPVWTWEHAPAAESNEDKEVGRTVHVLGRLRSALEEEQIKYDAGYGRLDIERRLQLLAAINAERRMLETQLHIKPTNQLAHDLPPMFQAPILRPAKADAAPVFDQKLEDEIARQMQ